MLVSIRLRARRAACVAFSSAVAFVSTAAGATIPDGRIVAPVGFTVPVGGFASDLALSPDGSRLAVLAQDDGAIDVIDTRESRLIDRLPVDSATGLTWTTDGLFVARGYTGTIARFRDVSGVGPRSPHLSAAPELGAGGPGLLAGVAEDAATHRLAVARPADRTVVELDVATGAIVARHAAAGQPYSVAYAPQGAALLATLYDSDGVERWLLPGDSLGAVIATGPHPTQLLIDGSRAYAANADGHDVVALDWLRGRISQRYDLGVVANQPPGQTPSGMALSDDRTTLFVTESGFDDVAIVDVATGLVRGRIPTGWYPMAVRFVARATVGKKDARVKPQLWIASAQGTGSQPDPGGEWNGTYTGLVQHVVVDPTRLAGWTADARRYARIDAPAAPAGDALPPIRHVVFVVRENKQFDEEFGDEPQADADPTLLVYGRAITPNAHALAERYTLLDNFMGDGEASIFGHAWTTQGFTNDYHERNAHARDDGAPNVTARVAWSIWPYPQAGEDTVPQSDLDTDWFTDLAKLTNGPRVNVSGVFGPRGELVDELARKGVSFRVFGEQLTMRRDGTIAPGLVAHADRAYPGAHIDFAVSDTSRAKLFLDDVRAHGLARYTYVTLPTDHTAGTKPGFLTPASYVADNDTALGQIVAGLSHRSDWNDTVVFVTTDDPQGTGDHVDAHREPAFLIGPYVRRGYVDHTHYSFPSFLRTVEALDGLAPLSIEDAAATPMTDAFARQPSAEPFDPLLQRVPLERNPGKATSFAIPIDGPDAAEIAREEWRFARGSRAVARDPTAALVTASDDDR